MAYKSRFQPLQALAPGRVATGRALRPSRMAIWHSDFPLDEANRRGQGCANAHLGIELVEAGDDYLKARMPVDHRTRQPAGVLHGGVSVVLAETLASWAAAFVVDPDALSLCRPGNQCQSCARGGKRLGYRRRAAHPSWPQQPRLGCAHPRRGRAPGLRLARDHGRAIDADAVLNGPAGCPTLSAVYSRLRRRGHRPDGHRNN
jgi:hypothetical protein